MNARERPQKQHATLKQWLTVAGAMLGAFMAILDISIVNSALPEIQGALSATLEEGSWISTSYLITEIVVIPLTGLLLATFSERRLLVGAGALFVTFSMLCGQSWSLTSMIAFRALQGLTGGILIPMAATIVVTVLPRPQRPIGLALFGVMATFAPSIGPTLGGWLTVNYSWKYAFYINLVPGLALIVMNLATLPKRPLALRHLREADWLAVALMVVFLSSLTVVLEEGARKDWFTSSMIAWLAAVATVTGVIFIAKTLASDNPIVNLRLLKTRNFLFACLLSLGIGMALYGSIFVVPLYLSEIQNYNALQIGEVLMWVGFPQLLVLPFVPLIMKKVDLRVMIVVGVGLIIVSFWMNAQLTNQFGYDQFKVSQLVRAAGQPLVMTPLTTAAYEGIAREDVPSASGLYNMLRNLGGSIGISGLSTLMADRYRLHFNRIAESVQAIKPQVQRSLHHYSSVFQGGGSDRHTASEQAMQALGGVIHREANVMSFADAFLMMAIIMAVACVGVVFMRKVHAHGPGGEAAH